jgi:hypothetical protein
MNNDFIFNAANNNVFANADDFEEFYDRLENHTSTSESDFDTYEDSDTYEEELQSTIHTNNTSSIVELPCPIDFASTSITTLVDWCNASIIGNNYLPLLAYLVNNPTILPRMFDAGLQQDSVLCTTLLTFIGNDMGTFDNPYPQILNRNPILLNQLHQVFTLLTKNIPSDKKRDFIVTLGKECSLRNSNQLLITLLQPNPRRTLEECYYPTLQPEPLAVICFRAIQDTKNIHISKNYLILFTNVLPKVIEHNAIKIPKLRKAFNKDLNNPEEISYEDINLPNYHRSTTYQEQQESELLLLLNNRTLTSNSLELKDFYQN